MWNDFEKQFYWGIKSIDFRIRKWNHMLESKYPLEQDQAQIT